VHTNKCPALAPLATLAGVDTARIRLDEARCQRHLAQVRSMAALPGKVRQVFAEVAAYPAQAAEQDLYAGLPGNADLALAAKVRGARPDQLLAFEAQFVDPRYRELLFRYRARHYADTLTGEEQSRWRQWRRRRLIDDPDLPERSLIAVLERLAPLRSACTNDGHALTTLDQVEAWCRAALADLQ
jgi:exodeoxyribonuclease-1